MESKYDHPSYRENAAAPPAIVKQDKVVTTQMRFISEAWKNDTIFLDFISLRNAMLRSVYFIKN